MKKEKEWSGAGVAETSYYGALERLLNQIGETVRPNVRCILTLRNRGAGLPDGGLFTADLLRGDAAENALPNRGVLEVKPTNHDLATLATGEQVQRYLDRYGAVLVTNLWSFGIVLKDAAGRATLTERVAFADSERTFWEQVQTLETAGGTPLRQNRARVEEFLKRAVQTNAPLAAPPDVAWFLASYARDALHHLEQVPLDALTPIRSALETALGLHFQGNQGDHFFRSTLVQTLFYGVFAGWVLAHHDPTYANRPFEWRLASWLIRVPMIRTLFEQVAVPSHLNQTGLIPMLDGATNALNRVDESAFFRVFEAELAVQYFYEPFLEQFDPALRRDLGVWYTPPEVVHYMVERVDRALREQLGIADGLADERVIVLDPACGTGAYLVAVLQRIERTLSEQGYGALAGATLKEIATTRLFGFELLPAPFVVAHLQMGLLLQRYGQALQANERAAVYLTNALTRWVVAEGTTQELELPPALLLERQQADHVKRTAPILVVLGNPPYNGYAGLAVEEERELSDAYRTTERAPRPQGQGLNDLYVRFFRMAERQIVERTQQGIVCFISNYSWLDGLSFTGMRERYLQVFDEIWVDNLHGDRIISEYAPDGRTSETIFAMRGQSVGIRIGTAITLMAKTGSPDPANATLHYRDCDEAKADERRAALTASLTNPNFPDLYQTLVPEMDLGLPFKPRAVGVNYLSWSLLPDLLPVSFPGVKTSRDEVLIEIDRDVLEQRMRHYFNPSVSDAEIARITPRLMEETGRFKAQDVRRYLIKRGFLPNNIVRYVYRPFDVRWLYWEPETKLLDEKRSEYVPLIFDGNLWIEARKRESGEAFSRGTVVVHLADQFGNGMSNFFPLYHIPESDMFTPVEEQGKPQPNLSDTARPYLDSIGGTAEELFFHIVAILHSPLYRTENAGALQQDWPRLPLPATLESLRASAEVGRVVAALLNPDSPMNQIPLAPLGVDAPLLRRIAVPTASDGGQLDPNRDFAISAGWGYAGRGGITMPGQGKYAITPTPDHPLGDDTLDIYLNNKAFWANIPRRVWDYTLGGYQVLKKWLSYREEKVLGRPLRLAEVRDFSTIAQRITALLMLEARLDTNYREVRGG